MGKTLIILFLLSTFSISAVARDKYSWTPNIRNFPKSEYDAGTQNWAISQDQNGFIYFANNDGLLCFDGVEWNLTRVSSSSPLRSILVDSKNKIYAGLINDFGIIMSEDNRAYAFKSLKYLLPDEYKEFDDIWRIYEFNGGIVFQCYQYIFCYKDNNIEVIKPHNLFRFSFKIGEKLLVQDQDSGIYELIDGKLVELPWWSLHNDKDISFILEADSNKLLIGTTYNGIYLLEGDQIKEWKTPVNEYLIKNRLYSATNLPGGYYAFGTILNGLIVSDIKGNVLHSLNNNEGIQNNTVLSIFVDLAENLWLGLDNGIDYIEINSPLTNIGSKKIGTGYACKVFKGNLYLGTNQGLYVSPFNRFSSAADLVLVENTAGQVWSLEEFDGQLLCGHDKGTFLVDGFTARRICSEEGAWKYISLKNNPEFLIGGHYRGLVLLKKYNNEWRFYKKIEGFEESSRYLYQDQDGNIWIGHSGRGIFKVRLNEDGNKIEDVTRYDDSKGIPSNLGNILFSYKGNIFVSNGNGVLEYVRSNDSFIPSSKLNDIFSGSGKLKSVVTGQDGVTWYIADSESGFIRENEDLTYTKVTIPFRKLKKKYVNEFEFIYPFDRENIFIAVEDGFVHYTTGISKSYDLEYKTFITRVEVPYLDSVLYLREAETSYNYEFPFRNNSFRFHFAAPFFENEIPLEFSYYLDGFSEEWSSWSIDTYKDFTTLREGNYIMNLKSRNVYGAEGQSASFGFTISPPWARSTQAYIIYLALLIVFVLIIIRYIIYRVRLSERLQEEKHRQEIKEKEDRFQREALLAEKEIIGLRNEKLRSEMVYRNKELANQTMAIIEKNKFLKRVNEDLNSIQDYIVADTARNRIFGLVKRIRKEIDIKHQNRIFETYFDEANEELFMRLKEKHPDLTPYDLRLCAFIRMNISTKEIATILNISYRGAEVSRYRLRKKMQLPREVNLSSYLSSF